MGFLAVLLRVAFEKKKKKITAPPCLEVLIIHPRSRGTTTPPAGHSPRFRGSYLRPWNTRHHSVSVSNIQHRSHTVPPPPSFSFHFLISSFLCFVFCHLPPNLLNPPRSPILMRRKTETTRIEGRRWQPFLSRGVVGNLHSFPGFWPHPSVPQSAQLDFVKSL